MFKRILAACLAAAALVCIASCKDGGEQEKKQPEKEPGAVGKVPEASDGSFDEDAIDYEAGLSTERFDGYKFRMLVRKGSLGSQYYEEPEEDVISNAVYRRNKEVEERYGITVTASESSSNDYETDALNSILAGDDAYDLVFAHSRAAFSYAVQGAAYDINDIESIHLDKAWWSKNIKDNCTVNGHLYVLDGDISTGSLGAANCLLFNKRIFDEAGFEYPYDMVKDGTWTFDEFAYLAKKGGADLNGDGQMNAADDRYGFVTDPWAAPINILYTGGQKIYSINDAGEAELTLFSNKTAEIYDEFFRLMDNGACLLQMGGSYSGNLFTEGRAMFKACVLGDAKGFRNMDDDFGVVPYPKFDEDDVYACVANGAAPLIIIPASVSNVERTGAITEALCAYGSKYVLPAFYEVSLKTKYARDEESEEMMDLIKDSLIYDIGYVAGGTFQSVGYDLAGSTTHDFASYYAAREASAKQSVKTFNQEYGRG